MTGSDTSLQNAFTKLSGDFKRIVIKVGSSVLTDQTGINNHRVLHLVAEIAALVASDKKIVLVSSGAVAYGVRKMALSARPSEINKLQALAAIGQPGLMNAYEDAFSAHQLTTAQILLTQGDVQNRARYVNAANTIKTLLDWNIIPVINENDTVATDEFKFGDNDTLGSFVASMVDADLFINLSDIDGFYTADPRSSADAVRLQLIETITPDLFKLAGKAGRLGRGGMFTKLTAAQRLARVGISTLIAGGHTDGVLTNIFKGIPTGTLFLTQKPEIAKRKNWIAFTHHTDGKIKIDDGATDALVHRGKSLLPSGVCAVEGHFSKGDAICVENAQGELIAIGLVNYDDHDLKTIMGHNSNEIESLLGTGGETEVIHRDDMVLADPELRLSK